MATCDDVRAVAREAPLLSAVRGSGALRRTTARGKALTVRAAADVFLDSLGNSSTLRSYGIGVGKTAERLGETRPLSTVDDDEVSGTLEQLWGEAAVNTWNARRAACCHGWAGVPSAATTARQFRLG